MNYVFLKLGICSWIGYSFGFVLLFVFFFKLCGKLCDVHDLPGRWMFLHIPQKNWVYFCSLTSYPAEQQVIRMFWSNCWHFWKVLMPFAAEPSHVTDTFRLLGSSSLNIFILKGCCCIDLIACKKKKKSRLTNKKCLTLMRDLIFV